MTELGLLTSFTVAYYFRTHSNKKKEGKRPKACLGHLIWKTLINFRILIAETQFKMCLKAFQKEILNSVKAAKNDITVLVSAY